MISPFCCLSRLTLIGSYVGRQGREGGRDREQERQRERDITDMRCYKRDQLPANDAGCYMLEPQVYQKEPTPERLESFWLRLSAAEEIIKSLWITYSHFNQCLLNNQLFLWDIHSLITTLKHSPTKIIVFLFVFGRRQVGCFIFFSPKYIYINHIYKTQNPMGHAKSSKCLGHIVF